MAARSYSITSLVSTTIELQYGHSYRYAQRILFGARNKIVVGKAYVWIETHISCELTVVHSYSIHVHTHQFDLKISLALSELFKGLNGALRK